MIDEFGAGLLPDLRRYYGVDLQEVIMGRGPAPAVVIELVQGLPEESITTALVRGSMEHRGWSVDRYMASSMFDLLAALVAVTVRANGGKPGKPLSWPRPGDKPVAEAGTKKAPPTVASLYTLMNRR